MKKAFNMIHSELKMCKSCVLVHQYRKYIHTLLDTGFDHQPSLEWDPLSTISLESKSRWLRGLMKIWRFHFSNLLWKMTNFEVLSNRLMSFWKNFEFFVQLSVRLSVMDKRWMWFETNAESFVLLLYLYLREQSSCFWDLIMN